MPRPIHVSPNPFEVQLSTTKLSPDAASGAVARDLGYLPERQLQPPQRRVLEPSHVFYVWPAEPHRA